MDKKSSKCFKKWRFQHQAVTAGPTPSAEDGCVIQSEAPEQLIRGPCGEIVFVKRVLENADRQSELQRNSKLSERRSPRRHGNRARRAEQARREILLALELLNTLCNTPSVEIFCSIYSF